LPEEQEVRRKASSGVRKHLLSRRICNPSSHSFTVHEKRISWRRMKTAASAMQEQEWDILLTGLRVEVN
jgi:hypothetical protein